MKTTRSKPFDDITDVLMAELGLNHPIKSYPEEDRIKYALELIDRWNVESKRQIRLFRSKEHPEINYARRYEKGIEADRNHTFIDRPILGSKGLYRVGTHGLVYNAKNGKRIAQQENKDGYLMVTLRLPCVYFSNRIPFRFLVHRLVLETFVGRCPKGMQACHFPDKCRHNNRLGNLRWDTPEGNAKDRQMHHEEEKAEQRHHKAWSRYLKNPTEENKQFMQRYWYEYNNLCQSHRADTE